MFHPMTLITTGFLTLVGGGLGLYLGHAAIGEIDPVYFGTPERGTPFHSDLSPYRPSDSAPAFRMAANTLGLGSGCVGCRTYPEEYRPVHDVAVQRYLSGEETPREAPLKLAPVEVEPPEEAARRQAELDRVARYASYSASAEVVPEPVVQAAEAETEVVQGEDALAAD